MIEIPEAAVLARQLNESISTKVIRRVVAGQNPHGFAFYSGDPREYPRLLEGKKAGTAANLGGMVEIEVQEVSLLFGDGVNLRFHETPDEQPPKHQLLIEFEDLSAISATISMYGGLWCTPRGSNDNPYYLAARDKISPLAEGFSSEYFDSLFLPEHDRLSLKAFLATEQRLPGLGNGVLQDILYEAGLHPKRKVAALGMQGKAALFKSIKTTLRAMTDQGGRDTERDLHGKPGRYRTRMSKNTLGNACPRCGSTIQKQAYLGGSIYFCPGCQKEN